MAYIYWKKQQPLQAENVKLKESLAEKGEYGYSQQVVDALTTERDKLKEQLRQCQSENTMVHKDNLAELEAHRWIPVEEILPEERKEKVPFRSEDVLIHCRGIVRRAFYMTRRKCWTFYHEGEMSRITHWKPIVLPEMP